MTANTAIQEQTLLGAAVEWLSANLPPTWKAEAVVQTLATQNPERAPRVIDSLISLTAPQGGAATLLVEARASFAPRDVEGFLAGLARSLRLLNQSYPILVVAPWLSPRSREVLVAEDMNYLDLSGNVRIALPYPPLYINVTGAPRNPNPPGRASARLKGPKAGRLVRLLVDARPPYGVSQISSASGLTPGYVSRLLEALDENALIARAKRGQVTAVDVPALIRSWTESYDVFKSNRSASFVFPAGPDELLRRLAKDPAGAIAITGSFAEVQIARVAAPALMLLYVEDQEAFVSRYGLLPADRGANVVLLRPYDPVVWQGTTAEAGLRYVTVSQIAADCLTGNGRMPSEGDALVSWMEADRTDWRAPSLSELDWDSRVWD